MEAEENDLSLYLLILLKNKSSPEEYVSFQMGYYSMSGYRKQIADKVRPLIPIIPLLYYHGDRVWIPRRPAAFFDLYVEKVREHIPDYKIHFQDIARMTEDGIRSMENNALVPGLLMQKYHKNLNRLLELAKELFQYFKQLESEGTFKCHITFVYLICFEKNRRTDGKIWIKHRWSTKDSTKNQILQLIDRWKKEYTILNLIGKRLDTSFICNVSRCNSGFYGQYSSKDR